MSFEVVGVLFDVFNNLGYGYREIHYQRAIEISLNNKNLKHRSQCPYKITYKDQIIGRYYMDFVIESKIVLEIKQGKFFKPKDYKQLHQYLIATKYQLGILAIFTDNGVNYKRIVNIIE